MAENYNQSTEESTTVPVPKPRRHVIIEQSPNAKTSYENVSIHLINKNINISDENLQNNTKSKLQNNKAFLTSGNVAAASTGNSTGITTATSAAANNESYRKIITELNDLHSDKNRNVIKLEEVNKLSNIYDEDENCKKPVPAPRRGATSKTVQMMDENVYENTGERKNGDGSESSSSSRNLSTSSTSSSNGLTGDYCLMKVSTGAVNKMTETSGLPPELPEKKSSERARKNGQQTASYNLVDEGDYVGVEHFSGKYHLKRSVSNSSLNSSQSGSSEKAGSKFSTSSPGHLLRTLGATSKLLTESITERVSSKTKGAKRKIDKMHKSSRERLAETTKSATEKLKNVGKNLHDRIEMSANNLSLGRQHKRDNNVNNSQRTSIADSSAERSQTAPPNDEVFQSISFYSPLSSKTNNCMNINYATGCESSYEIPKNLRSISSDAIVPSAAVMPPPLYDEVMKEDLIATASRNQPRPTVRNKIVSDPSKTVAFSENVLARKRTESPSDNDDSGDADRPQPSFPAPILSDGIYGKIKPSDSTSPAKEDASVVTNVVHTVSPTPFGSISAPARAKRRKDYEPAEIRPKVEDCVDSTRATIDSNEFRSTDDDRFPKVFSRDLSVDFSEKLRLEEKSIPSPARSDSWSYYDLNDDQSEISSSTPEPIYANDGASSLGGIDSSEPVYGVLYNIDSSTNALLTPEAVAEARLTRCNAKIKEQERASTSKAGCSTDILKEFDPLDRNVLDQMFSNKTNECILKEMETLLGEETYGPATDDNNFEYHSTEPSDDEDNGIPIPPQRLDSLPENPVDVVRRDKMVSADKSRTECGEERKTLIIHQNLSLRSDSLENIVDETNIEQYLAQTDSKSSDNNKVDFSRPTPSKSRWFLGNIDATPKASASTSSDQEKIINKIDDKNMLKNEKGPPPYSEVQAELDMAAAKTTTPTLSDKRPTSAKTSMKTMFSNVISKMEGIKRKASFRTQSGGKPEVKTIIEMVPRPCLTTRLTLHEGHLIRLPTGVVEDILKEIHSRKAYIRDKKFQAFCDKDVKTPKENIPLEQITTIQCVSNHKFNNYSVDMYCFEITTAVPKNTGNNLTNPNMLMTSGNSGNTKIQRTCHLYAVAKESERFIWMQKLLDSLTDVFPAGFSCKFYRAGWCYLKNSITSQWSGAWILLQKQKRKLLFCNNQDMNLECMDLRKGRCIVLKESDDSIGNLHIESGPTIMIDCPPYSIYLIMTSPRETKIWRHIIQEVAHNNGPSLKEQQLTKDDVPVLVDKCINFIYVHGSMSEGIYRKSGSENSITKLLNLFRTDAYTAQITRREYNEHDVANALKRFMRDLPDRLLGKYTSSFISVSEMNDKKEKISAYKELLTRLSAIEYFTLRKLIGHLHFIQSLRQHNKMDVANLAIVWGPTLLQNRTMENHYSQKEADVVIDLISLYKSLYQLSADEVAKEQIMVTVLQKYHAAAENLSDLAKKSGDLKVWITIDPNPDDEDEEKQQVNVTLTPNKTVWDICKELAPKMKREAFTVTLTECILNKTLHRPLHYSEKVFDIVLKWSYWSEADRKNNYLRLRPMKFMKEVERALKMLPIVSPNKELKFADSKSKSFKSYTLELNDGKITVMRKDKSAVIKVREIDLTKIIAYLGCEKKRDFQQRWAITLIDDNTSNSTIVRSRETPFIGHVIAGTNSNDQIVWYSSILHSLYGDDIMPNPEIIIP